LGVNGTGKTSLCRCLAGIYTPNQGEVIVHGQVRAIFDTQIGIQPDLTGRENAELLAEFIYPEDHHEHKQMIEEALTFSELGQFVDMPYRLYSNGMQARLCLSMISCKPCDLLILDEVFDGADIFFREKIATRVMKMVAESGACIFVSHDSGQIRKVCNRLIVLQKGQVIHDGDVEAGLKIYESPRTENETPAAHP
jgi:ABC-type polysaccharide/polyol phosphate transport system ATPase subunit